MKSNIDKLLLLIKTNRTLITDLPKIAREILTYLELIKLDLKNKDQEIQKLQDIIKQKDKDIQKIKELSNKQK